MIFKVINDGKKNIFINFVLIPQNDVSTSQSIINDINESVPLIMIIGKFSTIIKNVNIIWDDNFLA